jgi:hypothetical protein
MLDWPSVLVPELDRPSEVPEESEVPGEVPEESEAPDDRSGDSVGDNPAPCDPPSSADVVVMPEAAAPPANPLRT